MVQMVGRRVAQDVLAAQGVKLAHVGFELVRGKGVNQDLPALELHLKLSLAQLQVDGLLCHWCQTSGPGAAATIEFLHSRDAQRLCVVPEHAMKGPPLAVVRDERHRVILSVRLRFRLGKDLDRVVADKTRI